MFVVRGDGLLLEPLHSTVDTGRELPNLFVGESAPLCSQTLPRALIGGIEEVEEGLAVGAFADATKQHMLGGLFNDVHQLYCLVVHPASPVKWALD